jgi:hypothetical protein
MDESLKLEQKKKFEKINSELKKDKQMEREARQRALLDIKEDQEKRRRSHPHPTETTNNNAATTATPPVALTERQRIQLAIQKEKKLDQEQRQRILENIRNDKKDKKMRRISPPITASTSTVTDRVKTDKDEAQNAFIQVSRPFLKGMYDGLIHA